MWRKPNSPTYPNHPYPRSAHYSTNVPIVLSAPVVRPLLRHVLMPLAVPVVFGRVSIYEPSYVSDGFRLTARLLASLIYYCRSARAAANVYPVLPSSRQLLSWCATTLWARLTGVVSLGWEGLPVPPHGAPNHRVDVLQLRTLSCICPVGSR